MKKRIFLFDNLKFLLMTTVVIGHLSDCLVKSSDIMKSTYVFIYAFHMPLFIYLSGLFHSNRNGKKSLYFFYFYGLFHESAFISVKIDIFS